MKDYRLILKKLKSSYLFLLKFQIFDTVVITFLLNIALILIVILYAQKIISINLPNVSLSYLKITSIPNLPTNLDSINASASAFVVYDTNSRSVIAGKNQYLRFSPASTAKIMSAIIVLSFYDLDQYLAVPSNIYSIEGSKMFLVPGEEVQVRTLLYGMMLPSGNDAAYTLAYNYPGGVSGFVNKMNEKAKDLKLLNTHFEDFDGYDDKNYTTAIEIARLSAYGMQNQTFRDIVKTQYIELSNKAGNHTFYLKNLNELLSYENVVGIKTGFTNEAGGVLVTGIIKNNSLLIAVVLKSPDRFSDTQDLMKFINEKVNFSVPFTNSSIQ